MAAQPTIMNRMQNMPQAGAPPAPNPAFPQFASKQNWNNFLDDFYSGAGYGNQGGAAANVAYGSYKDYKRQGKVASEFAAAQPFGPQTKEIAQESAAMQPSIFGSVIGAGQEFIPQHAQVEKFLNQIKPQPNVPQAMLQKYSQKTPLAQSGPQIISQGPGGEQKPYFSFEKYFSGSPSMRSLITSADQQASGMPQGPGEEDSNGPVPNTPEQQPMEQWGRPQGRGFWNSAKGYAYDVADWLKNSPWSQRIVGGAAELGVGYLTGGATALFPGAVSTAAGGLFKGLMGQVTNFLAERTDVPPNAENPNQPSAATQALQQPAILRTA